MHDYLVRQGHTGTLRVWGLAGKGASGAASADDYADVRKGRRCTDVAVVVAVREGRLADAMEACGAHFPGMLSPDVGGEERGYVHDTLLRPVSLGRTPLWLNMHMQAYVEMVRAHTASPEAAPLEQALGVLHELNDVVRTLPKDERAVYTEQVEELVGLLTYQPPDAMPPALALARRDALAVQVNAAILVHTGAAPEPVLTELVRHTHAVTTALHTEGVPIPRTHPIFRLTNDAPTDAPSIATAVLPPWTALGLV